ncbi:homeobox protein 4 [Patella vulgata]|uniref:homeobox protein 4 n=1 Tax=Patella vulgata TaxID=6465 RepID=UPI0024A84CE1|nr:homeobox protein 4 [Patella vulgata]
MEKKKRRRSIRNLRRQSINSFNNEGGLNDTSVIDDSTLFNGSGLTDSGNIFGTVWMDTQEESLKEQRKKRRSSILLQKPLLKLDTSSLELETMRADITTEKSPTILTVSPDLMKFTDNKQQSPLITPDQSFNNNLNMAFVGDFTTPVLCQLNTSTKKVYPVTPDVDEDILADSPYSVFSPYATPVTSQKILCTAENLTPSSSWTINENVSPNCFITSNPNTPYLETSDALTKTTESIDNYMNLTNDEPADITLNNSYENNSYEEHNNLSVNKLISKINPDNFNNSPSNATNPSHLSYQLDKLNTETPTSDPVLTPINEDKCHNLSLSSNQAIDETNYQIEQDSSKETEENTESKKLISPSSISESLDNIASGAMGLFNTLVRKISIRRGKSQKKTLKRLKADKNLEGKTTDIGNNEQAEKNPVNVEQKVETNSNDFSCTAPVNHGGETFDTKQTMEVDEKHDNSTNVFNNCVAISPVILPDSDTYPSQNVDMIDCELDNFNMTSLAESIDSQKENEMKNKRRSRRQTAEYYISAESGNSANEETGSSDNTAEESNVRKSKRTRRKSLDIYQAGQIYEEEEPPQKFFISRFVKYNRPKKPVTENLEDLYMNKNYKAPLEKTWETIYESPGKSKQPCQLISKKRFRRVVDFDGFVPTKYKRRLQKASNNGWDVTGKKNNTLTDDFVQNKLSELYNYLDSSFET